MANMSFLTEKEIERTVGSPSSSESVFYDDTDDDPNWNESDGESSESTEEPPRKMFKTVSEPSSVSSGSSDYTVSSVRDPVSKVRLSTPNQIDIGQSGNTTIQYQGVTRHEVIGNLNAFIRNTPTIEGFHPNVLS